MIFLYIAIICTICLVYWKNIRANTFVDQFLFRIRIYCQEVQYSNTHNNSEKVITCTHALFAHYGVHILQNDSTLVNSIMFRMQDRQYAAGVVVLDVFKANPYNNTNTRIWLRHALQIHSNVNLSCLMPQKSKPYVLVIKNFDLVSWPFCDKEKFVRALATESSNCGKFIVLLIVSQLSFANEAIKWNGGQKIWLLI